MQVIKARLMKKASDRVGAEKNSLLDVGFGFSVGANGKKFPDSLRARMSFY